MRVYLVEAIDEDVYSMLAKEAEIVDTLLDADIIFTRNLRVDKAMIDVAKNLKCIAIHGTGVSEVDIPYAKSKGITVFNAPYQNADSVAELNVMLTLMALRKAKQNSLNPKDYYGSELKGKTVGVLGLGHIGDATQSILAGFGAMPLLYNRTQRSKIALYPLEDVLKKSDIVILAMSLDKENYHIIDKNKISLMKDGAILVNTARGGLVDEEAILEALKSKKLACYASDVFEHEPLDENNPLLKENVICYPHIGSNTREACYRVGKLVVDQIIDFIHGKEPRFKL